MSKVSIHCFTKIDDAEPARTLEGDEYQAISDSPVSHRVVLNPNHDDPKKSFQVDVRDGVRNPTDPLRFARVEVYEAPEHPNGVNVLAWYGDKDGGAKTVTPVEELVVGADDEINDQVVQDAADEVDPASVAEETNQGDANEA